MKAYCCFLLKKEKYVNCAMKVRHVNTDVREEDIATQAFELSCVFNSTPYIYDEFPLSNSNCGCSENNFILFKTPKSITHCQVFPTFNKLALTFTILLLLLRSLRTHLKRLGGQLQLKARLPATQQIFCLFLHICWWDDAYSRCACAYSTKVNSIV